MKNINIITSLLIIFLFVSCSNERHGKGLEDISTNRNIDPLIDNNYIFIAGFPNQVKRYYNFGNHHCRGQKYHALDSVSNFIINSLAENNFYLLRYAKEKKIEYEYSEDVNRLLIKFEQSGKVSAENIGDIGEWRVFFSSTELHDSIFPILWSIELLFDKKPLDLYFPRQRYQVYFYNGKLLNIKAKDINSGVSYYIKLSKLKTTDSKFNMFESN